MARNLGRLGTRLTATSTAITIANAIVSATIDTVIRDIGVSFDGTVVTNAPIDVQVLFASTAGTMTTTPAPTKIDNRSATTLLTTAGFNATAEPTAGNEIFRWHIHPQTGLLWQGTPYMDEVVTAGGAAAKNVTVKFATAPSAAIDTDVYMVFEE